MKVSQLKKNLKALAGVLIVIALAIYVVRNPDEFAVVERLNGWVFFQVFILNALTMIVLTQQLYSVSKIFGLDVRFSQWFRLFLFSRCLNRFVPQIGNAYLAAELSLVHQFSLKDLFGIFASYSLLSRILTALIAAVGILFLSPDLNLNGIPYSALFLLLALAGCGLVVVVHYAHGFLERFVGDRPILLSLHQLVERILKCFRHPRLIIELTVTSLLNFVLYVVSSAVVFNALEEPVGYGPLIVVRFLKNLLDAVSITPGNVGLSELLFGAMSGLMQTSGGDAIIVSAVNNVALLLSIVVLAGIAQLWEWAVFRASPDRRQLQEGIREETMARDEIVRKRN